MNETADSFVPVTVPPHPISQKIDMPIAKLIAEALAIYGPVILLLFGFPGNVLSYVVMNQAQFRRTTTSFFIRVLAVCDNSFLIAMCLQRLLLVSFLRSILVKNRIALRIVCIEYICMTNFTVSSSRYILVLMTYDRLVALMFPLQARAWPIMKIAKILTIFFISLSFAQGMVFVFAEYSDRYAQWICPFHFPDVIGDIYTLYGNVTTAVSCGLLVVANVLIAWSLYSNARRMKTLQNDRSAAEASQQRSTKNRQISLMLLLISCFYLLSNVPREFNQQFWPRHIELRKSAPDLRSLTLEVGIFVEALNYAINFYLYVASCRKFRMTLVKIFIPGGGVKSKPKAIATDATNLDNKITCHNSRSEPQQDRITETGA